MNIVKDVAAALKKSVRSFPATLAGSFAAAVFAVLASAVNELWDKRIADARETFGSESHQVEALREASETLVRMCGRWSVAAVFAAVFAFLAGMLCICAAKSYDRRGELSPFQKALGRDNWHRASFVLQALSIPLCVLVFFLFRTFDSSVTWMRYLGLVCAMVAVSVFLLYCIQKETQVAPNITVALVIAGIASSCLMSGLMLVVLAFQQLIYKFDSPTPYLAVICFTYMVFGVNVFIAYTAREEKDIRIPRPFTVIMSYVLFPVTLVLLAVLYFYLLKCLVTRSMPVGQINPFVSIATALFFIFYVCLEDKIRFFKNWGSLLFLPLIPLQILAFAIRVNAYGFTESRVASLYYIIVSVIFCLLPFVQRGRCMKFSYLLIAFFLLLATWGPLNVISVTLRSQSGRVVRVFRAHGLYADDRNGGGRITPDSAGLLSIDEKAAVVSAYDKLEDMDLEGRAPSWWVRREKNEDRSAHFLRLFGFEWSRNYEQDEDADISYSFNYNMDSGTASRLDVSAYAELYSFDIDAWVNNRDGLTEGSMREDRQNSNIVLSDGTTISIVEELEARLKERGPNHDDNSESGSAPLLLCRKQGFDIYVTSCHMFRERDGKGGLKYFSYNATGFVCR